MVILATIGKLAIPIILGVIAIVTLTRFAKGESISPKGLGEFGSGLGSIGTGFEGLLTGVGKGTSRLFDPLFTFVDFAGKVQTLFGGSPNTQTGGGSANILANESAIPPTDPAGTVQSSVPQLSFNIFQGADPSVQTEILATREKFPQFFSF